MEPWKFRKMRRTKNIRWIKKTVIKTDDHELAAMGLERLRGDQEALFEIVCEADWSPTQCAAVALISDPEVIDNIASGPYIAKTRQAAIRKSANQPLLCRLAVNDKDLYTDAVETMTDEALLAEVAKTAKWERAGVLAFNKLTDETLRRSVCGKDAEPKNRLGAAAELGDYKTLMEVFKSNADTMIGAEALKRLEEVVETLADETLLAEVAKNAEWKKAGVLAFNKLTDETLRRSVCGEDAKSENRLGAAAELGDYKTLMEAFKSNTDTMIRKEALQRLVKVVETLTDEAQLAEVAKTSEWAEAGALAFRKLTDEVLRRSVCGEDAEQRNRLRAAIELEDQSIIARFVMTPKDTNWFIAVENCTDKVLLETQLQDEKLTLYQKEYLYRRLGRNEEAAHIMLRCGDIMYDKMKWLNQITNPDLLMDLVKNTSDWFLRPEATKKLVKTVFPNKMEWMRDAAIHDCSIQVRIAAYESLPECNNEAVRLHGELSDLSYEIREDAARALMDIFEQDKLALTVLGRDAIRLIEQPHQSYDTPSLDEIAWNGTYADEPSYHTDTGIGLQFRKYEGFNACD